MKRYVYLPCIAVLSLSLFAQSPKKGGLQLAEPEKGATTNLGTDVDAVRQRIETALANDQSLNGSAFTINVTDDTVEITGVANNGRERTAARRIVQSFAGNLRVKDRITVAGVNPPSADPQNETPEAAKKNAPAAEEQSLAKPESDEGQPPVKKANKPKKNPKTDGDQATEDPRDPRKNN